MTSMRDLEPLFFGRTFDDFLFRPQHSPVARRRDVDLSMPLVPGVALGLPIVGANMDTVVGEEMAFVLRCIDSPELLEEAVAAGVAGLTVTDDDGL